MTDGLPTQGATPPVIRKTVDGDARMKLFERAIAKYPRNLPFNVVLMPMEGDPQAAERLLGCLAPQRWRVPHAGEGLAVVMPRRHKRRETEIFSISFLDCITCGLGSVVLLLVLSNVRAPTTEQSTEEQQH